MISSRERAARRHRGCKGGLIAPHRAMRTLDLRPSGFALTVIVALVLCALWALAINDVTGFWTSSIQGALDRFGVEGSVETIRHEIHPLYTLEVPRILLNSAPMTSTLWWGGLIGCLVALLVSWLPPRRWLPLRYMLRMMAFVQLSAQLFFWLRPDGFPYDIGGYTEVLLTANVMVIGLVPVIYGVTFFPLDFESGKKLLVTLLAMAHLVIFVPVQYLLHAVILHESSLLFMPLLFWTFGLTLDVFVIITLYGWAASWETLPYRHHHWRISLRPTLRALFALGAILLLVGFATRAAGQEPPVRHSVEAGASYGEYDGDLGHLDSQFVRLRRGRDFHHLWSLEVGRAQRFDDSGFGVGLGYRRHLRQDTSWFAGVATGTGDVIFPEWRVDAGVEHGILPGDPLLVSLAYTHIQSKSENESDGLTLGARLYTSTPFIFSGFVRREWGSPGSTTSDAFGLGLLYHRANRYTLGAGVEYGDVSYLLVGPTDAFVDYEIRSAQMSASKYLGDRWGMGVRLDVADAEFYEVWSVELKVFREW